MNYTTVWQHGQDEHIEKKSRFIGQAWPIQSEEEAREIIERTRKEYWDASHNVFTYRVGDVQRFTDDGEPSGTAGKPMLDVLLGRDLQNVLVIVTRYFGGTLLGTGGLVRAYTKGAQIAVEAAGIIDKAVFYRYDLPMDYTWLGKMQYAMNQAGFVIEDTVYTDQVTMKMLIRHDQDAKFLQTVVSSSDGKLQPAKQEAVWAAELDGKYVFFDEPV
ncbi:MAG: YigZ family protein [Firmicutes bacterium]|nr:YigZ family protein [Bacillota bacterium]MBR6684288.1 YigZ family protein [Bacillota bacterium]